MEDLDSNNNNSEEIELDSEDSDHKDPEEIEKEESSENIEFSKYNSEEFNKKKILEYLMCNNIILNKRICEVCHNVMNLNLDNSKKDGLIWRCKHKGNNKHDIKYNIRNNSIFENSKADIRLLHFIIFYNFIERKSINKLF